MIRRLFSGRARVARVVAKFTSITAELAQAVESLQQEHAKKSQQVSALRLQINSIYNEMDGIDESIDQAQALKSSIEKLVTP